MRQGRDAAHACPCVFKLQCSVLALRGPVSAFGPYGVGCWHLQKDLGMGVGMGVSEGLGLVGLVANVQQESGSLGSIHAACMAWSAANEVYAELHACEDQAWPRLCKTWPGWAAFVHKHQVNPLNGLPGRAIQAIWMHDCSALCERAIHFFMP
eukprot:1157186-Pelagomonas_calceolata.AAC.9